MKTIELRVYIHISNTECKVSQFADDIFLFLEGDKASFKELVHGLNSSKNLWFETGVDRKCLVWEQKKL